MFAPVHHVHCRYNQQLRASFYEPVNDARVTQVITDAKADFAPWRIPNLLFRSRQPILEKLNGHAFYLAKNNLAIRGDHKCGVVKIIFWRRIFAADDQVTMAGAAPSFQRVRHWAIQGIFAQYDHVGIGILRERGVERRRNIMFARKFHLHTGDAKLRCCVQAGRRVREYDTRGENGENCRSDAPPFRYEKKTGAQGYKKTNSVHAEEMKWNYLRPGKRVSHIQPGKFQVIQFAAEIFQTHPEKRNQRRCPNCPEAFQCRVGQPRECTDPKRQNDPEHNGAWAEDVPKACQLRRNAQKARCEPCIERLPARFESRQLGQASDVSKNEQMQWTKRGLRISDVKTGSRRHYETQHQRPLQGREAPLNTHTV